MTLPKPSRPRCYIHTTMTTFASIDTQLRGLATALNQQGVHTRILNFLPKLIKDTAVTTMLSDLFAYKGPKFMIESNGKLDFSFMNPDGTKSFPSDDYGCPRLTWFESSPAFNLQYQSSAPKNQIYSVIDSSHLETLKPLGYRYRRAFALPHAGPRPMSQVKASRDRPIDILFMGRIGPTPPWREWLESLALQGPEQDIVGEVAERSRAAPSLPLRPLLGAARRERGLPPDARWEALQELAIQTYLMAVRRKETLTALAGLNLHICGEVSDPGSLPQGMTWGEPLAFHNLLGLMDESKLVLNFSYFLQGAHERVFYGLSRGACIASDPSDLMAPGAGKDGGVVFFAPLSQVREQLAEVTRDLPALDRRREAGRAWYAGAHTWDHRAETLLAEMQPFLDEQR